MGRPVVIHEDRGEPIERLSIGDVLFPPASPLGAREPIPVTMLVDSSAAIATPRTGGRQLFSQRAVALRFYGWTVL